MAFIDKMAEWLRRLTVNPLGSASAGSNSKFVVCLIDYMVKGVAICSLNSMAEFKSRKKLAS